MPVTSMLTVPVLISILAVSRGYTSLKFMLLVSLAKLLSSKQLFFIKHPFALATGYLAKAAAPGGNLTVTRRCSNKVKGDGKVSIVSLVVFR